MVIGKTVEIPRDLHAKLKHVSVDTSRELRSITAEALRDWYDRYQKQKDPELSSK